ncbi:hypothetical protein TIFTF001_007411 [Ficus carica]|uniref:Protein kinase domain-containing protein n=1 Tax=Ficus carica TaxID=3494 RepID=A0AA87ZQ24_FICCA|nr:hypothetical protein TIFTF001_007411 [Ficus carica]
MFFPRLLLLLLLLLFSAVSTVVSQGNATAAGAGNATCPLDFSVLRKLASNRDLPSADDSSTCQYIIQSLHLVQSNYLLHSGNFVPPIAAADSCWSAYQSLIDDYFSNFDIRSSCGFQTSWISEGCMNITTRAQFEAVVPLSVRNDVVSKCNQSLLNGSPCATCTTSLSNLPALYLTGPSIGNVSDCTSYPFIYAAAFANHFGPTDLGTAKCLFALDFTASSGKKRKKRKVAIFVGLVCSGLGLLLIIGGAWWLWRRRKENLAKRRRAELAASRESGLGSALESISGSTNLVKFTFDEIKKATRNFSREYIIGRGGYGNVYKGVLPDGTEVALKRFKNCSAAGDANFAHEVEVIASVRHVNLVALRGYCIATTNYEGHQRIIVCDLMTNGSLYDHLFGSHDNKLSWPIRQNIALGTARGLAYLHYGAQPAIIHRDIKANNILLDENFEAKLYARPTMDQVVKMLDADLSVPSIPERPIPLVADIDDIERSMSSSGSGHHSSSSGFHQYHS